ncbi:hypothetical protein [Fimbriiglobus ruber]|uniref:hypothetical protein n=1 Tax=Fimbriiglobus ruber TaxID=1908690 RepID=UPI000B4B63D4|nr:hypothetical protein [Fimbriiglobus ruber]
MSTSHSALTSLLREFTRDAEPRTDTDVLALFVRCRDEAAFAAIVERHGPMVRGIAIRPARRRAEKRSPVVP